MTCRQGSSEILSEAGELEQQLELAQSKLAACAEKFASAKESRATSMRHQYIGVINRE